MRMAFVLVSVGTVVAYFSLLFHSSWKRHKLRAMRNKLSSTRVSSLKGHKQVSLSVLGEIDPKFVSLIEGKLSHLEDAYRQC